MTQKGKIRHIYVRTNKESKVLICIVSSTENLRHTDKLIDLVKKSDLNVCGIMLNINSKNTNVALGQRYKKLYGSNVIGDMLFDLKFNLYVPSFFQVNREQAEKLYEIALDFADIKKSDTVIDLYCGAGTISLCMAKQAGRVIGVEVVKEAIENAMQNAIINKIDNVKFVCQNAADASKQLLSSGVKPNIICVDPPRKGLDNTTIDSIIKMNPEKIVYVSCNCATLSRDLKILKTNGWNLKKAELVDMFPRTPHIETVTLLEKRTD